MKIWSALFITVFLIKQVKSEMILLDSNDDCQTKGVVRRQIIRPFPPGTAMFVDGKCICGGQNEILYEYVPGARPDDEAIADNMDSKIIKPQSNNRVVGNYGSLVFSSDAQILKLFDMRYKGVCCNCVHSSPLSNKLHNNYSENKLPNKVSEFEKNVSYSTTRKNEKKNTTYLNINNSSDPFNFLVNSTTLGLNGSVDGMTPESISNSLKSISKTTESPKPILKETLTTENSINRTIDKQNLSSTTISDRKHTNNYIFVETTKPFKHFKPKYIPTFKKNNVISYNNNGRVVLIIT